MCAIMVTLEKIRDYETLEYYSVMENYKIVELQWIVSSTWSELFFSLNEDSSHKTCKGESSY